MTTDFPFTHLTTYTVDDLAFAVQQRDLEAVRDILASGDLLKPQRALVDAIFNGDVHSVKILVKAGCPMNTDVLCAAGRAGSVECLQLLIGAGCPLSSKAISQAALSGNVECLQLLIGAGCPLGSVAACRAACSGNVECLQLLIAAGCRLSAAAICSAASSGNVECLKVLLSAGCPIDDEAFTYTTPSRLNNLEQTHAKTECLRLLVATGNFDRQKGFPMNLDNGYAEYHDVLTGIGFPWNRRLVFGENFSVAPDRGDHVRGELMVYANRWSDEELNTAFARRWIWPADNLDKELQQRVHNLKTKKAETERVATESCTILPLDVVKHVLCSYF